MVRVAPGQPRLRLFAPLALALLLASLAALALAPDGAIAGPKACRDARTPAAELEPRTLRKSLVCVINKARVKRDIEKLDRSKPLKKVAQSHAEVMVEEDCLGHTCPGEATLEERIRKSGYPDGARRWKYAENTGCALTVKAMLRHWLATSFHRHNLLNPEFRDIGAGAAQGAPPSGGCETNFATFTVVFGKRELESTEG